MENDWKVIALIYSGKPDPQWHLTEMQADHFLNLFSRAADSRNDVVIPSILGYKGLRLLSHKKQFLIYNGTITLLEKGLSSSKKDEGKNIEKYLLKTAPKKISDLLRQLNIL